MTDDKVKVVVNAEVMSGLEAMMESGIFTVYDMYDIESTCEWLIWEGHKAAFEWVYANEDVYHDGLFQGFRVEGDANEK